MTDGTDTGPSCPHCDGPVPAPSVHHAGILPTWLTLLGMAIPVVLSAGGYIWWMSAEASQVTTLGERVGKIEVGDIDRLKTLATISERLSRMEPMLQFLTDREKMRDLHHD